MRMIPLVQETTRTHLQSVEEQLNHDESRSLESERSDLAKETEELEVDLSVGG